MSIFFVLIFFLLLSLIFFYLNQNNITMQNSKGFPTLTIKEVIIFLNNIPHKNNVFGHTIKEIHFVPGVLTESIKRKINCIINPILCNINLLCNLNFTIREFNLINIYLDQNYNFKIFVDFFFMKKKKITKKDLF